MDPSQKDRNLSWEGPLSLPPAALAPPCRCTQKALGECVLDQETDSHFQGKGGS